MVLKSSIRIIFPKFFLPLKFPVKDTVRGTERNFVGRTAIIKVDVKPLLTLHYTTVSDVMLAMIGNPFSVVYLSVLFLRH